MKTIITYGTFDLFHVGHVRILKRLREMGDRLIVGVSSDEFNAIKGKKSFFSYEERAEIVGSSKYVDFVFPEHNWDQKREDIIKYGADMLGMGDDWRGKFDHFSDICEVVYLDRTQDISTTDIKKALSMLDVKKMQELEESFNMSLTLLKAMIAEHARK